MFFRAIAAAPVAVGFVVAALPFASAAALLFLPSARADDPDAFSAALHDKAVLVDKRTTPPSPPPQQPAGANQFVAALIDHGAEVTDSNIAVHIAHGVCGFLGSGYTRGEVAGAVRPKMHYTKAQAATFVDLSIDYYCPEYLA